MSTDTPSRRFDSRLIQKPRQQPRLQRTAWGFVTLAFWAFYFYLWAPVLTLASWLAGGHLAWVQLYERKQQLDPFLMIALPVLLVGCAALLILWAEYNRFRFAGRERRAPRIDIALPEIAYDLGASVALAQQLSNAKSLTLHMDDHARPVGLTERLQEPRPPLP